MTNPSELSAHQARELDIPEDVRDEVLERDNCQCQVCGTTGVNVLQLHHCRYRSQGGLHTAHELVTACWRCHNAIHEGCIQLGMLLASDGRLRAFVRR